MWTKWELIGMGVDAAFALLVYKLFKNTVQESELIQGLPMYEPGKELKATLSSAPDKGIAYACVDGVAKPVGDVIKSQFVEGETGLVQVLSFIEHKSRRSQGYWSDAVRVIKNQTNTRPFMISSLNGSTQCSVEVQDPLLADYLQESLVTIYDYFEPTKEGLISRGIDRLFGEVTKGYEEKEEMLSVGLRLVGIGKLTLDGSKIVLSPPDSKVGRYIVSGLSRNQIVAELKSQASSYKMLLWICSVIGAGLMAYWIHKNWRGLWEEYKLRRSLSRMRRLREERNNTDMGNNNGDENENRDPCVVCLDRPKELIVLDCGHLCLCGDCGRALPAPRTCPICRLPVQRLIPVYNA